MLTEQYLVGDRVVMKMDREARSWGRKGAPDGTVGEVVGRYRYKRYRGYQEERYQKAGLYEANGALSIRWFELPEGSALEDYLVNMGGSDLRLEDAAEQERRETEFRAMTQDGRNAVMNGYRDEQRIDDLPETPFLPGDEVQDTNPFDPDRHLYRFRVLSIDYNFKYQDGSVEHVYNIQAFDRETDQSCYSTMRSGTCLELVVRGNIWRELNGEPLIFKDMAEESAYATARGRSTEVRNPKSNLYSWTKDEVLNAIEDGIVDGFAMPTIPFSFGQRSISAQRFNDRELGERVRAATLEGFGVMA